MAERFIILCVPSSYNKPISDIFRGMFPELSRLKKRTLPIFWGLLLKPEEWARKRMTVRDVCVPEANLGIRNSLPSTGPSTEGAGYPFCSHGLSWDAPVFDPLGGNASLLRPADWHFQWILSTVDFYRVHPLTACAFVAPFALPPLNDDCLV
jgi:hypothetical protein